MGADYKVAIHCPYLPDKSGFSGNPTVLENTAKIAVKVSDTVKEVFEEFDIPWQVTPTEVCLTMAEAELALEIAETAEKLAEALAESEDPLAWIAVAYYAAKLAKEGLEEVALNTYVVCYTTLRTCNIAFLVHLSGQVKPEPADHWANKKFDNTNWPLIKLCNFARIELISQSAGTSIPGKFSILGATLSSLTITNYRLLDFGTGKFENYFPKFNKSNFTFNGTLTVPRGRTLKYTGNLIINGDLWVRQGGSLYVTGNLNVNKPSDKAYGLASPTGRVIVEDGSTLIVGGNLTCTGTAKNGSIMVNSPVDTRLTESPAEYFAAAASHCPTGLCRECPSAGWLPRLNPPWRKTWKSEKPGKRSWKRKPVTYRKFPVLSGPGLRARAPFFAKYPATLLLFRHKNLNNPLYPPMIVPLTDKDDNALNVVMDILSNSFSLRLNGYLGENFFTHAPWWVYGEGIVPVLPKVKIEEVADITASSLSGISSNLSRIASLTGEVKLIKSDGTKVLSSALKNGGQAYRVYATFIAMIFIDPCGEVACKIGELTLSNLEKSCKSFMENKDGERTEKHRGPDKEKLLDV